MHEGLFSSRGLKLLSLDLEKPSLRSISFLAFCGEHGKNDGVTQSPLEMIRQRVEETFIERNKVPRSVDLPLTEDAERVLEYAAEESQRLGKKHIGTEHLLLGLLSLKHTSAAIILSGLGVKIEEVRSQIASADPSEFEKTPPPGPGWGNLG